MQCHWRLVYQLLPANTHTNILAYILSEVPVIRNGRTMWAFEVAYAGQEDRKRDIGRIAGKAKSLTDAQMSVVESTFKVDVGAFVSLILKFALVFMSVILKSGFTTSRMGSSSDSSKG